MALTVEQDFPFVSGSDTSQTLSYIVYGTEDDYAADKSDMNGDQSSEAAVAALTIAPATYDGLARNTISNITHQSDLSTRIQFKIDIAYGELQNLTEPTPQPNGTIEVSYSSVREPVHVDHSLEVTNTFGTLTGLKTYGTLIGVKPVDPSNVDIEGTDTFVTRKYMRIDWTLDGATITKAVRDGWHDTVGHPNSDTYLLYEPHSVMFQGLESTVSYSNGSERNTFLFELGKNIPDPGGGPGGLTISGITGIWKNAFDLLDPVYEFTEGSGLIIRGFKVHRMHDSVNYAAALMPFSGELP